jgi:hypothetical protein
MRGFVRSPRPSARFLLETNLSRPSLSWAHNRQYGGDDNRTDDLPRFTTSNHYILLFDCAAGVVLQRSADRLEKSPLGTTTLLREAY